MTTPRVSFVIPAYNGAAYLAETLDSCLRQSTAALEVIVVDDCSKDSTVEMVEYFRSIDLRVRLIRHDVNKGRSVARNTGISAAKTDILMMLDADDIALPNRVKDTLEFFKKNKDVDLCYSKFHVLDELGAIKGYLDAEPFDEARLRETKLMYIGHSTMSFRRRVFDKVQYTDGDYSKHAIDDWKFQMDALKAGFKFGAMRKITAQYRVIPKLRDEKKILELKNACLETLPC